MPKQKPLLTVEIARAALAEATQLDASKLMLSLNRLGNESQPMVTFEVKEEDFPLSPTCRKIAMALKVREESFTDHHGVQKTWDFGDKRKLRIAIYARYDSDVEISLMEFPDPA